MTCSFRLHQGNLGITLAMVEFDRPEDDAYSRVTNPERYQPVVDAVLVLIDQLEAVYDVSRTVGVAATHFASYSDPEWETIRLVPAQVVPLKLVEAATAGRYAEVLTKRAMRCSYSGPWGS